MEKQEHPAQGPVEQEEELTEEHVAKFNQICKQAAELAQDYQRQSEELKAEIVGMVNIYNQNRSPEQAVPVEKIMEITNEYQQGMREVQSEYGELSKQLKKQQEQRSQMMQQIGLCFSKLQKMQQILMERNRKKEQTALAKKQKGETESKEQKAASNEQKTV